MAKFNIQTNASGTRHEVELDLSVAAAAKDKGAKHVLAHLDNVVAVDEGMPTARQQIYAQMGLNDKNLKLKEALAGTAGEAFGVKAASVEDNAITGRLVTQAYLFDAIENKLRASDYGILGLFNRKAAVVDSIASTKFERPIINFSQPEAGRSRAIAQLAEPANMLLLTTSDVSYKIPGTAIGIEVSDQAQAAYTIPMLSLSIQRQAETEHMERIEGQLLSFLNGDTDIGMSALSAVSGAVTTAATLDTSIVAAGGLTQDAWVTWLFSNSRKRKIDTVITDIKGALAIERRTGRPTVNTDNATSKRIDVGMTVVNPTWPDQVEIIISQDPNWPANTIVGFDSTYGYHVVNSTVLSYEASEQFAIRRSTKMRFDSGSIAYRLFDDAWSVLTLTV